MANYLTVRNLLIVEKCKSFLSSFKMIPGIVKDCVDQREENTLSSSLLSFKIHS